MLRVGGRLAEPYGQLEIRPASSDASSPARAVLPDPSPSRRVRWEGVEARLVVVEGTLEAPIARETGGDLVLRLVDETGTPFRARAAHASGIPLTIARPGTRLRLTGIVGQRASRKGALDGYRLWLRDRHDLVVVASPAARPAGSSPSPTATPARGSADRRRPRLAAGSVGSKDW